MSLAKTEKHALYGTTPTGGTTNMSVFYFPVIDNVADYRTTPLVTGVNATRTFMTELVSNDRLVSVKSGRINKFPTNMCIHI